MKLQDKLSAYYKACGHDVRTLTQHPKVVETRIRNQAGTDDVCLFWVEDESPSTPDRGAEARITGGLAQLNDRYPHAKRFLLLGSMSGYSQEFKQFTRGMGVTIREEVLFFDAEFRSDSNREAADIARHLVNEADQVQKLRVNQPFVHLSGHGEQIGSGDCVVSHIHQHFAKSSSQPRLTLIVGPAGAGKSIAFNEFFRRCYEDFQKNKARRMVGTRPLALTPRHLSRVRGNTFSGVVDTFLQTEVTLPIGQDGMNWMIEAGLLALLCDGLDEILASDDLFFEYLLERLTTPPAKGRIVVCVRDSLFNTCVELKEFLSEYGNEVDVLQLDKWRLETKRAYIGKRFEKDARRVEEFVQWIQAEPALRSLSDNAFYCRVIGDMFDRPERPNAKDASAVCAFALVHILEREYEKGVISKSKINQTELLDVLEAAAAEDLREDFKGIPVEELNFIAEAICTQPLSNEEQDDFVMRLVQLPIFTRSDSAGKVTFTHEILGYYLIARSLAKSLSLNAREFCQKVGNDNLLARGTLLDLLAERIKALGLVPELWRILAEVNMTEDAYRVVLQVAIIADPTGIPQALKTTGLSHRKLGSVVFRDIYLSGAVFDQSDLTNATFTECDLRKAKFDGTTLYNTTFDLERHDLEGVHISDFAHAHSIRFRGRYIDEPSKIVEILTGAKVPPKEGVETCPTTKQVAYLFSKFVRPNGQYRRDSMDMKVFLLGRRFEGAPDNETILDVLCSHHYLNQRLKPKPGVSRNGEKLGEIVDLVTGKRISPGLKAVIAELRPN